MKIVFHDVDGCLNADANTPIPIGGKQLPLSQLEKLGELGRKIDDSSIDHLIINTGRSMVDTLFIVDAIASRKLQYVIAEHGAIYRDVKNKKNLVPQGVLVEKLDVIHKFIHWYRDTGAKILNERVGTEVPILDKEANLTLDARNGLDSQYIYNVLQEVVKIHAPFDYSQLVFHHSAADGYVDAMSQVDKGDGVGVVTALLSQMYGTSENIKSIAIGNGLNDMPMLEVATIPACPKNAEPEVREFCRSRSGLVSEYEFIDATLKWLEEYL